MRSFRRIIVTAAVILFAATQLYALADALCKLDCAATQVELSAKHACCPKAQVAAQTAVQLADSCNACLEARDLPTAANEKTNGFVLPVITRAPMPTAAVNPPAHPKGKIFRATVPITNFSIPITLQRFLI